MNLKNLQLLFLLLCSPLFLLAQQQDFLDWMRKYNHSTHDRCGHEKLINKAIENNPSIESVLMQNNATISNWIIQKKEALASGVETTPPVVTVPVVVHLVYQNEDETLTDEEVMQMIEKMSADFRYMNSDAGNAPQEFIDVAADVEIDFCLAAQDPEGLPTNGITRTLTNVQFFTDEDEIKFTGLGGHDAWNSWEYLNVWVGKLTPGLGGYAYLPGTIGAAQDGVVVSSEYIKNPDNLDKGYRVLNHEVGHWFNLQHVFGLGPCDEMGDLVDDTPLQLTPTFGCPTGYPYLPDSDVELAEWIEDFFNMPCPYDLEGHMYTNYMDYSDPVCMNMFTLGQKERMQAALNTLRPGLITSAGCTAPGNLPALEASLETLLSPSGEVCPGAITAKVYVRNLGQNDITTLTFSTSLNGQTSEQDWTGNISTGNALVIDLPINDQPDIGNNNLVVNITQVNGGVDANSSNNQGTGNFDIYGGVYEMMVEEGFENNFPPAGWELEIGGTNNTEWIQSTDAASSGNTSMKGNNYGSPAILFGADYNYIYLPRINLENASNPALSFDLAYKLTIFANPDFTEFFPDFSDELVVEVSADCGKSFQAIYTGVELGLATVTDTVVVPDGEPAPLIEEHIFTPEDFETIQLSLSDYIGEKIIIRFLNVGISQPVYVDNINLSSDQMVNVNETEQASIQINVAPNPSNGKFEVSFEKPFSENVELSLIDVAGRIVKKEMVMAEQDYRKNWEMTNLPAGLYFLKAQARDKVYGHKIVVY